MPVSKPPQLLLPSGPATWSPFLFRSPVSGLLLRSLTTSLLSCTQAPDVWSWPLGIRSDSFLCCQPSEQPRPCLPHFNLQNILLIRLSSCHSSKASLPIWLPLCEYPSAYLWLCFLIVSQSFSLFWPCLLVILSTFPTGRGLSYLILILVTVILFIKSADPPCICIQVLGCLSVNPES